MPKKFLYYCRISVKEGLDIETQKPHLERFINKTISRKSGLYSQLFIIAKNFKEDENSCNSYFKITSETGLVKCMKSGKIIHSIEVLLICGEVFPKKQ